MKTNSTDDGPVRTCTLAAATAEVPASVASQFPEGRASTGTVDDDDEPEDEHDGENEASVRETSDDTEAQQEFERDDEDVPNSGQ